LIWCQEQLAGAIVTLAHAECGVACLDAYALACMP
jgi:hypothetical protein